MKYLGLRQVYALDVRRVPTGLRVPVESFRPIDRPALAANFFKAVTDRRSQESLVALHLDGRKRPIAVHEVARGATNVVHVSPRDVLAPALYSGASGIIIAHNHPSGDAAPSEDDAALTDRMKHAGEIVGVPVFDHLVVGSEDAYSFQGQTVLKKLWEEGRDYSSGGWGPILAAAAGALAVVAVALFVSRGPTSVDEVAVGGLNLLGSA